MALPPVIWKKRVLVPFWSIRVFIMLLIIFAYAFVLEVQRREDILAKPAVAVVAVFMTLIIIVLLLDILAIVLFARNALKPGVFLIISSFQTGFWAGVLIVELVAIGRGESSYGIWFSVFVFLTFLGLLIYAIVGYCRARKAAKRGQYTQAHNPSVPAPLYPQYQSTPEFQPNTAYNSHDIPPLEMQNQHARSTQSGATGDYYQQQPAKPAHMV